MTIETTRPSTSAIERLRATVAGRVIAPADPDYESTRAVMYGGIDLHPGVIVRARDAHDVSRVVTVARETGTELAIRCGGHSGAGHSSTEGGIVLDLRELTGISIDPEQRTAWAGAGLTAAEVTRAAGEHGLAIGFGDTGSVGIGGITTGGGVGFLVRKHGLTIDNLLAAEVVTADGTIHLTDAETEPDLFWAIRGGGGNFGVVTRFKYQLHRLEGIVGGILVLPATPETVEGFIAAAEAAPEELSTIANVMAAPPMPFLPQAAHGKLIILGMLVYAGNTEDGIRAIQPFRDLAEPLADMVRPISYAEMFPPEDPDYHPTAVSRTMFIDHVDTEAARTIIERVTMSDAPMRAAQLRVLGGAAARVPAEATAYAHRSSRIMVNLAAFYEGPDDRPRREAWVREFASVLHQGDDAAYVNFLLDEGPERIRAAYPGKTWERLVSVKRRYDPENLFHRNQNIPPVSA